MKCMVCNNKVYTNWGIYCFKHQDQDARQETVFENLRNYLNNNNKWNIAGSDSSLESLRDSVGLKNHMPKQATSFLQLIKSVTVMSKL